MNSFYTKLQESLDQGHPVMLATSVDCLVEFSDSYDVLIAQKAFLCQDELTAETPSMASFWQAIFASTPEEIPNVIPQDTWWTFYDELEHPFPDGVLKKLAAGEALVLATVIAKASSAPDCAGAKLAVDQSGTLYGTLGDSAVDAEVAQTAQSVWEEGTPRLLECSKTDKSGHALRILLEPIN